MELDGSTELFGPVRRRASWGLGADDGNRTRVASLEDWGSTIELHPRSVRESSSFLDGSPVEMITSRR